MRFAMVVAGLLGLSGCRRPLAPGEARCTTTHGVLGDVTNCRTGQPRQADPQPARMDPDSIPDPEGNLRAARVEPTTPANEPNWWCTEAEVGESGGCDRSKSACERRRANMGAKGFPHSACTSLDVAACFNARRILDSAVVLNCAPSIHLCRSSRDFVIGNAREDWLVLDECGATK